MKPFRMHISVLNFRRITISINLTYVSSVFHRVLCFTVMLKIVHLFVSGKESSWKSVGIKCNIHFECRVDVTFMYLQYWVLIVYIML